MLTFVTESVHERALASARAAVPGNQPQRSETYELPSHVLAKLAKVTITVADPDVRALLAQR